MNRSSESELTKVCLRIDKPTYESIQNITETLGIPQHEILKRILKNSESLKIFEDATKQMKKLSK